MAYAHANNEASYQASKKMHECYSKSLKWNEEKPVIKVNMIFTAEWTTWAVEKKP